MLASTPVPIARGCTHTHAHARVHAPSPRRTPSAHRQHTHTVNFPCPSCSDGVAAARGCCGCGCGCCGCKAAAAVGTAGTAAPSARHVSSAETHVASTHARPAIRSCADVSLPDFLSISWTPAINHNFSIYSWWYCSTQPSCTRCFCLLQLPCS